MKHFGSFHLDTDNQCLWRDGNRITLPPKPFAVLRYLVEHPGRLVSHDELLDAVWPETYVQPQVLRTYMLDLRKVLEDDPRNPRFIQSIPKRGYSFVCSVSDALQPPVHSPAVEPPHSLIARSGELDCLHAALRNAAAGTRQVLFLTGESGIGKTALLDTFRESVEQAQSAMIAMGQCVPGFAGKQEYYPISDALRQISSSPESPAACRLLGRRGDIETGAAQPAAVLMPGDVCDAVEQIPAAKPLLLILEDLQWADEPTIHVVSALARRRGRASLMIVATLAPQTSSTAPAAELLIQDLRMRRLCCELPLHRLSRAAVGELIRTHLNQQDLPEGLQDFVHTHSEGNPRFALAIVEHLISQQVLIRSGEPDTRWILRAPLEEADPLTPGEVARTIELEISHLTPREQQILEAGSLAPIAFPAWMVAAALDEDVAAIEDTCDELARRLWFIKRAGQDELPDGTRSSFYVFTHALYREVLYGRQSPARRGRRHIGIADNLRRLFRGREQAIAREAAAHYQAAGDMPNAIAMLSMAARHAMELRAVGEAAELHQQIADLSHNISPAARLAITSPAALCDDLGGGSGDFAPGISSAPAKA